MQQVPQRPVVVRDGEPHLGARLHPLQRLQQPVVIANKVIDVDLKYLFLNIFDIFVFYLNAHLFT